MGCKMLLKGHSAHLWRGLGCIGCVEAQLAGRAALPVELGGGTLAWAALWVHPDQRRASEKRQAARSETGDAAAFKTYEEFRSALHAQLRHLLRRFSISQNVLEELHYQYLPNPVASMFTLGCLESGRDLTHGGAEFNTGKPGGQRQRG